jgi:hypothetical protein
VSAAFGKLVTSDADDSTIAGTLREVITNATAGDTIYVQSSVETISLGSRLTINQNLTILGNGVTITKASGWTTVGSSSQLLYISGSSTTVSISGVHFTGGEATTNGAAINIGDGNVNLESCIFSGNETTSSTAWGGAIYKTDSGSLTVKGCTFYGNSSGWRGGAIYHYAGTLTLTGNLFYGNTASNGAPVVYKGDSATVTSGGYNVVDVTLGPGNSTQSGFTAAATDKLLTAPTTDPVDPAPTDGTHPYKPTSAASSDVSIVPVNLAGYPAQDFYGTARPVSGTMPAGAVWE